MLSRRSFRRLVASLSRSTIKGENVMAMDKEDGDPSTLTTNGPKDTLRLRSQDWFQHAANPILAALYTERFLNYGLTREELQPGRPIIGIPQTASDLPPSTKHHLVLADPLPARLL